MLGRKSGAVRVGIGGWTFAPWRGPFYPTGLPHARELSYAAERLGAIEINGTYYRRQAPKSFATWAKATPPGFVFSVKASRFCTNRKVLAEAGEAVAAFLGQGLVELGEKLGPILWQFMPSKQFDEDDFGAFLRLLPSAQDGVRLRHAIEVRHESFRDSTFVALARKAGAAIVFADSPKHPAIADLTAEFVYARLQDAREDEATGYASGELDRWADVARQWARGDQPEISSYVTQSNSRGSKRDVFIFMINGAKLRAPAAAQALISRLQQD